MKTVIVTNNNLNSMLSLSDFLFEFRHTVSAIVVTTRLPGEKNNVLGLLKMLKQSGPNYTYFKVLTNVILPQLLRARRWPVSLLDLVARLQLAPEVIVCGTANESAVIERIKKHEPEILLAAGATHIFNNELVSVPSMAPLNLHPSILPSHAGVSPQFWCLRSGDSSTGGTLHVIAPKLDAGAIVDQRTFDIDPTITVFGVLARTWRINNDMLVDFYRGVTTLAAARSQDLSKRSYHRHPTRADVAEFRGRGKRFYSAADIQQLFDRVRAITARL